MKRILIGGSPCQHWSIAQKNGRETEPEGLGWELFKNYLIAKEKFKPDFFLYENNKSAAQPIKDQISKELGVPLQYINSALVSAQNRQRFYAHNIPNVPQPEDRGILLRDILESGADLSKNEKAYCLSASYNGAVGWNTLERKQRTMVAGPVNFDTHKDSNIARVINKTISIDSKSRALTASSYKGAGSDGMTVIAEPVCVAQRGIYESTGKRSAKIEGDNIVQVYEAREDGKTNALTTVQKDNAIAEPVCLRYERTEEAKRLRKQYENHEIHHGFNELRTLQPRTDGKTNTLSTVLKDNPICEPVRIGCYPSPDGTLKNSQGMRLYSIDGKSVNITAQGGGMGAKTGLYAISIEFADGIPLRTISLADGKEYTVYQVSNGLITIKDKQYPIKLQDGFYIIRKLTVTECCRLQGMPDWWFDDADGNKIISNTQCYKGLGNGWQLDTVKHIMSYLPIDKNEEILCLSLYDGIGTGRRILEELGYTNVTYVAYEIDKYCVKLTSYRYPSIIHKGDAFQVRNDDWRLI